MNTIINNKIIKLCENSFNYSEDDEIFDLNSYLEKIDSKDRYNNIVKTYPKNIIRLQNKKCIYVNYRNKKINLIPDGFTKNGHIIYIYNTEININTIIDYIKIVLYLCELLKCDLYINDKKYEIELKSTDHRKIKDYLKNKKRQRNYIIDNSWVPASKTRNYALNDTLLDYCEIFNVFDINDTPNRCDNNINNIGSRNNVKNILTFTDFILNNGIIFEDNIMKLLIDKFPNDIIKIAESYEAKSLEKYNDTFIAMQKGIPIIYQGILHNEYNKTYGSADLIVRSDYINLITNIPVLSKEEEKINAPYLGNFDDFISIIR